MSQVRLALAITELSVGGAGRCLTNLAEGLDRDRFSVQVYSLAARPADERAELVRRLESAKIPVHFVGATSPRHVLSARRKLSGLLAQQSPHVLQTFLFHANVLGSLAGGATRVPHIV